MLDLAQVRLITSLLFGLASLMGCGMAQPSVANGAAGGALMRPLTGPPNCPANQSGTGIPADGDFSQASDPGDLLLPSFKGNSPFAPSWTITKGGIKFAGTSGWGHNIGACSVGLDVEAVLSFEGGAGAIKSMPFDTIPGQEYALDFNFSADAACPPTTKKLRVVAGGQSTDQYEWNTGGNPNNGIQGGGYASEQWSFIPHGKHSTVEFISLDPRHSACGPVVFDIYVQPPGVH